MSDEREGGDITAADMVNPPTEPSNIVKYFSGMTVLVTGATGYIGRLMVEKLLRTCQDVRKVYILMRPKKGKSCEQRFREYFDDPLYERLKRERRNSMQKLSIIVGDCALPDLGIKHQDRESIIAEVNCIIHCAATVRFDEKLRTAVHINLRGTRDLLRMARQIKDLKSVVYMSTAYSFCPRRTIDEQFYEPTVTGETLITMVDSLKEDMLEAFTPILVGEWPNTHTFTKSIAEDVVKKEGVGLPVAIIRPSTVVGTAKEPVAGWIDNLYGATGVFVGVCLGAIRTLHCDLDMVADLVPGDYVVNASLAAAWDIANTRSLNVNKEVSETEAEGCGEKSESEIPIYNYVSSVQRPITWRKCMEAEYRCIEEIASPLEVWKYTYTPTSNKHVFAFLHFTLHMLPAYVADFVAFCIGKKPQFVKGYKKVEKFLGVLSYFATQQWVLRNSNTQELWSKLNPEDRRQFDFNMAALDWDLFFHTYTRGCRVYLLKDPLDTIPQGRVRRLKLKIAHYALVIFLLLALLKIFMFLWNLVF